MVITGFLSESLLTANKADPDVKSVGVALTLSLPLSELFLSVLANTTLDQASGWIWLETLTYRKLANSRGKIVFVFIGSKKYVLDI